MKQLLHYTLLTCLLTSLTPLKANLITANSTNYTSYLLTLLPNDTLHLTAGTYSDNLSLNGLNGTASQPIVIIGEGNTTRFEGQSCCNTVSITQCSYLIIKNLQLDGLNQDIDAVKAEGTTNNWAHHITLEYLTILNYSSSQQNVGISTKCSAWDWVIRKNKILDAGTGMYLGNSPGDKPFVNGLIEYNYIANTIGYNIEIKHQIDSVRDDFPGTSVNGKTIIRHNVFTKNETTSSTGGNARPNLLVGGFPPNGWGSTDYYEIYGNFFYNNPVEALFQGTGNIIMYQNIFVNHFDPAGIRAVYLTPQNGISPQDIKIFHNTIWALNSSGGIRLYNPNPSYQQYCYANAVFSPSPITNFTDSVDNVTDTYSNASNYVLSSTTNLSTLNLYPQSGKLIGTSTPNTLFQTHTDWDKDFNQDNYDWTFRGAYSGCCSNNGWQLQLDTMASPIVTTAIPTESNASNICIYPNPTSSIITISTNNAIPIEVALFNVLGEKILTTNQPTIDLSDKANGIYFFHIKQANNIIFQKIIKQ